MKKHLIVACCICLSLLNSYAQISTIGIPSPKHEIRAVWLTTIGGIDWPHSYQADKQKAELREILDHLKTAGINTVLLQTRVRGTTIYPSAIEPFDGCMTGIPGKDPRFDPLQFAIDECHSRGMQLHAWVVTIPVGKWKKLGCTQLKKKHPKLITKIGEDGFMNPENPETANYLTNICQEIVERYDVDGIHLDYIRYPETWKLRVSRQKGRENITNIVSKIYHRVKLLKPWVMVSCSPIGKHDNLLRYPSNGWNARTTVCQDAQQWLKDGIMDALFPMMYFRDDHFFPFAIDWQEHSYGRFVVPGLGIYFLDPKEGKWTLDVIDRQLNVIRDLGMGHCYFRSKFFTDNVKGVYDLGCRFNQSPALIPPMTWMSDEHPQAPSSIRLTNGTLSWTSSSSDSFISNNRNCAYLLYNIYASDTYPVDIEKAENLIVTRFMGNELHVQEGLYYAVTAQNRYGIESEPCQMTVSTALSKNAMFHSPKAQIVSNSVELPFKASTLDADFIIIETLQGRTVSVHPYKGNHLSVRHLPEGIYAFRSLGRKGRNHRLGYFSVKRH
jgi:hypothetical protein